jgi:hypothetical protein
MKITTVMCGAILLSLGAGCFAEIHGGYYLVDDPAGVQSKGYMVGVNVGAFYDHKQQVRVSAQVTQHVMPVDVDAGGSGNVLSTGGALQGDYQFLHFGTSDKTMGITAGAGYGQATVKLEPTGGAATEETGGTTLNLFGGLIMHLPYNAPSKMAGALMVGGEVFRAGFDTTGDFNAMGVTGRFRLSWSPIVWRRTPVGM